MFDWNIDKFCADNNCRWNYRSWGNPNGVVYVFSKNDHGKKLEKQEWHPLNEINNLYYPLGYTNPSSKDAYIGRIFGYVPVICLLEGVDNIISSIQMIFKRVILNENSVTKKEIAKHSDKITVIKTIHAVDLSSKQRLAVLGLAIGLFFRGVINIFQVGVVLYPFDAYVINKKEKHAKTSLEASLEMY